MATVAYGQRWVIITAMPPRRNPSASQTTALPLNYGRSAEGPIAAIGVRLAIDKIIVSKTVLLLLQGASRRQ